MLSTSVQTASDHVQTICTMGWFAWSLSIDKITSRAMLAASPESACLIRGATFAMNIAIASCLFTHLPWKRLKMAYNHTVSHTLWLQKLSSADHAISGFRHTSILLLILNILHQLSYSKCNCLKGSLLSSAWNEFFQTVYSRPASWHGNSA